MKKSIKIGLITLSLSLFVIFSATSQVTIGTLEQPLNGTLLDLKESNTSNGDANSEKGLMLPRVTLTTINSLSPMLSGADFNNGALKSDYTGLIVYNVSTTAPFQKGLYSWDGTRWNLLRPISVENGLVLSKDTIRLGGDLTQPTTINLNSKDLILTTSTGSTTFDSSNGDLIFKSSSNKVAVGRVSTNPMAPQMDTLNIKGNINLDEPMTSVNEQDHYLVLDSTGTVRCRPSVVTRISELAKGLATDWSKADPNTINDFYFIDRAHVLTLPLIDGTTEDGKTPGGTIEKFRGRVIRFYIYGGPGPAENGMQGVTFKGVRIPASWSLEGNIKDFFFYYPYTIISGTTALTLPLPSPIIGSLRVYDGGGTTTTPANSNHPASRFRFIDIICDGKQWWVNNQ